MVLVEPSPRRGWLGWLPSMLAILAVSAALFGGDMMTVARHCAIAALIVLVGLEIHVGNSQFMTSPLVLLSAISTTFFSVIPGLWARFSPNFVEDFHGANIVLPAARNFPVYVGSEAESIVLTFGMICLFLYALRSRQSNSTKINSSSNTGPPNYLEPIIIILVICTISIVNVATTRLALFEGGLGGYANQIRFITPPLISICLFFLARSAVGRGARYGTGVGVVSVLAILALGIAGEGKIMVFIAVALTLYVIRLNRLTPSRIILISAAILLVCVILLQTVQVFRTAEQSVLRTDRVAWFTVSMVAKVVWRQTETGFCLRNLIIEHSDTPFALENQLFWIKGLVPRVVWPDKPNLSLGSVYATRYCGIPVEHVSRHSSSITLLGQPVIFGGWVGLIVHVGMLLFALSVLERYNSNPHTLSAMAIGAMLPWLIDFDQDFGLYVANLVKFALVMAVVIIPAGIMEKRRLSDA